jgi:hypothetical protein
MQNDFSKLTLSTLTNEFLHVSYIQLVIFLSISFKYYFFYFFIRIVFFLNILFFNFWEKKKKMWKRNNRKTFWKKRKHVRETIKK